MNPSIGNFMYITLISLLLCITSSCSKDQPKDSPLDTTGIFDRVTDTSLLQSRFNVPMEEFIGANGFHEDEVKNLNSVGLLRAYCNWDWFQGDNPNDEMIFQYSRGGWYFDDAFKKIKEAGITTAMCFQGAIKNLQGRGNFKFNDKPVDAPGMKTTDPNSYKVISNALFQIAARYGKTKVADAKLHVPANQKVSGLDLIEYLEVWNEPDKDWEGKEAQFTPEEYAAMLSICYDRIKEADPKMKVVMGGLATLSVDYVKKMKAWFDKNRADKKFAADVVNVHIYAYNNKIVWGKTWPLIGPAETPEDALLKEKSAELVDYCKANIPHAMVWVSEFGWDTNPESVLTPKKIDGLSLNEIQGRWIVRGYLAFAAAGIDAAQVFSLIDPSQNYINTPYGTAGLIDRTLNFSKKESWYYTSAMKNAFKNMAFAGEVKAADKDILIYKFKDLSSNKGLYAIWSKTSENRIVKDFQLPVKDAKTASMTELVKDKELGMVSAVKVNPDKTVTVTVSEKPVFITVDNI